MLIDWWSHQKDISETVKNWVQVAGVLGAIFLYYKWLFERRDRSTQVLFELENRFSKEADGCLIIENEASYRKIRLALIEQVIASDEATTAVQEAGPEDPEWLLKPLDSLLRFYVLLLGIREAGQVPDSSLRACYRYWLGHYFNPGRREFRLYISTLYPTLRRWLSKDRNWWTRLRRKTFFRPEGFGWGPGHRSSRQFLRRAVRGKVLVITGAGISAASSIPTYRGTEGIWRNHNPRRLATRKAFDAQPDLIWEWYQERRALIQKAEPNAAHYLLTDLAREANEFLLLTQNVDDLHERAGTKPEQLVHIHGEILENRCSSLNCPYEDRNLLTDRCPICGSRLRPNVVWFDEDYRPGQRERVEEFLEAGPCDLVLVIGTTASFPDIIDWALRGVGKGGSLIEINPHETHLSAAADKVLRQVAEDGLREVLTTAGIG